MLSSLWLSAAFAGAALASPSDGKYFRYDGLCEASAAAIVGPNRFAVASDDSDVVQIYERNTAIPQSSVPISGVTDLEGAAVVGGRLFWVTSHSLNKNGKDEDGRKRLIETAIADGTFAETGRYGDLRTRIATLFGTPEWPLEASLNIEGMAAAEGGGLLVGFRAPLRKEKAAVLRLRDPHALIDGSAAPAGAGEEGTDLWWLNLDKRGIRSLERASSGPRTFLILAGAIGESDRKPALFWWNGVDDVVTPGPKVEFENRLPADQELKSRDIVPEAAIVWPDGTIQILGDNEANCKEDGGGPWFPSLEIPSPTLD